MCGTGFESTVCICDSTASIVMLCELSKQKCAKRKQHFS